MIKNEMSACYFLAGMAIFQKFATCRTEIVNARSFRPLSVCGDNTEHPDSNFNLWKKLIAPHEEHLSIGFEFVRFVTAAGMDERTLVSTKIRRIENRKATVVIAGVEKKKY
jgi:hypothetical protein